MKNQYVTLGAIAVLSLVLSSELSAKRISVLANAKASDVYVEISENVDYLTYHFIKGKYYGGSTQDEGMDLLTFEDIADSVSKALRKRDYYPEPDKERGDLLIMISWGRTSPDPDMRKIMGVDTFDDTLSPEAKLAKEKKEHSHGGSGDDSGNSNTRGFNNAEMDAAIAAHNVVSGAAEAMFRDGFSKSRALNVALLGLEQELAHEANGSFRGERGEYWKVIEEERYFVVLNAFDYMNILDFGKVKQLWSLRYNTKATGVGFQDAIETMTEAVANLAGTNLNRMVRVGGTTGKTGEIGELEVIGIEDNDNFEKSAKRKKRKGR